MCSLNRSVYENVDDIVRPISLGVSLVISDVSKMLDHSKSLIFCPFCLSTSSRLQCLENHLSEKHQNLLSELIVRSMHFDLCPFCTAKFYNHYLVAKHSLIYHGNLIFDTYFVKYLDLVQCLFCNLAHERKDLTEHIEKAHILQYYDWFGSTFSLNDGGIVGLVQVSSDCPESRVDDLSILIKKLRVGPIDRPRSILKLRTEDLKKRKLPVRRELRFDVSNKENNPSPSAGLSVKQTVKKQSRKAKELEYVYRCGECSLRFERHTEIVQHVKTQHKTMQLLKPLFQCCQCDAHFYSKSYLKMHTDNQHSVKKLLI